MIIFFAILLTVLTFGFVAYPLFRRRLYLLSANLSEDRKLQELHSERDTTYSMLKELEFDFRSGILTEEDYKDLEARYKGKAISILRSIDDLVTKDDIEDEIEKQVMTLRQGKGRFCPQCGERTREDDRFCSHCGASLRQEGHDD